MTGDEEEAGLTEFSCVCLPCRLAALAARRDRRESLLLLSL